MVSLVVWFSRLASGCTRVPCVAWVLRGGGEARFRPLIGFWSVGGGSAVRKCGCR